ncbi:MAG TPA: nucleotidyltransferase family protein [Hyphomonadaceae bacterium]|nr:nucleotidyltransferase family protein [Hyphomonadaceae bacterium]HPI48505.1 nucleotidyltransferase family protein [Hyphomonadaceae bacterium]
MSVAMNRTAIVMLASGLSRRYGRKDKMLADLGGQPLIEHAAHMITEVDPLTRVAVCPSDRPQIGERLINRFVIAVNKKPKTGLGHSIAVGVNVALQFKPDAIMLVMGDMPFVESWILEGIVSRLGSGVDIVHSGGASGVRPPTAFGPACFDALAALDGDDGAKQIIGQGGHNVVGFSAPAPLLMDVDTKQDLDLARQQLAIRQRYENADAQPREHVAQMDIAPIHLGRQQTAGVSFGAQRR